MAEIRIRQCYRNQEKAMSSALPLCSACVGHASWLLEICHLFAIHCSSKTKLQ